MIHSYIKDFFHTIDTEVKAYWLGFIYADGCVRHMSPYCSLSICLQSRDKSHIERFKREIKGTQTVTDYARKEGSIRGHIVRSGETSGIVIYGKQIVEDLIVAGCTPRKRVRIKFPTSEQVPPHLIHHFIRGYFDGDGSIYSNERKHNRSYTITFTGQAPLLSEINRLISQACGIKTSKIYHGSSGEKCQYITWGGNQNIRKIYKYMYKDAHTCLERKRERFVESMNQKPYVLADKRKHWAAKRWLLTKRDGTQIEVQNLTNFCRENTLYSKSVLMGMSVGRIKTHKDLVGCVLLSDK